MDEENIEFCLEKGDCKNIGAVDTETVEKLPQCNVCLSKFLPIDTGKLICGHVFCLRCLVTLIGHQTDLCPTCRQPISGLEKCNLSAAVHKIKSEFKCYKCEKIFPKSQLLWCASCALTCCNNCGIEHESHDMKDFSLDKVLSAFRTFLKRREYDFSLFESEQISRISTLRKEFENNFLAEILKSFELKLRLRMDAIERESKSRLKDAIDTEKSDLRDMQKIICNLFGEDDVAMTNVASTSSLQCGLPVERFDDIGLVSNGMCKRQLSDHAIDASSSLDRRLSLSIGEIGTKEAARKALRNLLPFESGPFEALVPNSIEEAGLDRVASIQDAYSKLDLFCDSLIRECTTLVEDLFFNNLYNFRDSDALDERDYVTGDRITIDGIEIMLDANGDAAVYVNQSRIIGSEDSVIPESNFGSNSQQMDSVAESLDGSRGVNRLVNSHGELTPVQGRNGIDTLATDPRRHEFSFFDKEWFHAEDKSGFEVTDLLVLSENNGDVILVLKNRGLLRFDKDLVMQSLIYSDRPCQSACYHKQRRWLYVKTEDGFCVVFNDSYKIVHQCALPISTRPAYEMRFDTLDGFVYFLTPNYLYRIENSKIDDNVDLDQQSVQLLFKNSDNLVLHSFGLANNAHIYLCAAERRDMPNEDSPHSRVKFILLNRENGEILREFANTDNEDSFDFFRSSVMRVDEWGFLFCMEHHQFSIFDTHATSYLCASDRYSDQWRRKSDAKFDIICNGWLCVYDPGKGFMRLRYYRSAAQRGFGDSETRMLEYEPDQKPSSSHAHMEL